MKINFNSIEISNFMSVGDAKIHLQDRGYTLVSGVNNNPNDLARSNGSGKSSIFEAIVWCLTGDTIRGNKAITNSYGNDGAFVSLKFTIDTNEYIVTRTKDHSKYKTNLKIEINGEDKSGKGIRDSEKLLKEYLPELTTSLIGSVIILGQGMPNRFTNNSPSGRKEVLESLCKTDFMIEDVKKRIVARKANLHVDLRFTEDKILEVTTKSRLCEEHIDRDNKLLDSLVNSDDYDTIIADLTASIETLTNSLNDLKSEYTSIDKALQDTTKLESDLHKEEDEELSTHMENNWAVVEIALNRKMEVGAYLKTLRDELSRMQSVSDICPFCKQKLPDVHKPDTSELESKISSTEQLVHNANQEWARLSQEYEDTKLAIFNKYKQKSEEISSQINSYSTSINDISTEIQRCTEDIAQKREALIKTTSDRDNLAKNIEDCKKRIEESSAQIELLSKEILYNNNVKENLEERLQVINKFNAIATRDFRGYLLQGVIEYINNTSKKYAKDIFETDLIDFSLDGNNISISYNGKQYESLSGGERQKVDIIIQLSIRDMLCLYTNFSSNLLALDEIFDNLDDIGSQKIIDLISNKLSDISSIFIISHHGNELNIPYDNEIIVTKGPNGVSSINDLYKAE